MLASVKVARCAAIWQLSKAPYISPSPHNRVISSCSSSPSRRSLFSLDGPYNKQLHTCGVRSSADQNEPMRALYRRLKPGGLLYNLARRCNILEVPKYRLRIASDFLIESIVDHVDYDQFYRHCDMSDTFLSWYLVTELHLWMLCVRLMENGPEGALCKKFVIEHLWSDLRHRLKMLGVSGSKETHRQLLVSSDAFKAALVGYDEGLLDDRILAGVLWRRMFVCRCDDLTRLESLLAYVRRELARLDNLSAYKLFFVKSSMQWGSFKSSV